MKHQKETYNLCEAMTNLRAAQEFLLDVQRGKVTGNAKQFITVQLNRINAVMTDIKCKLTPESYEVLNKEVMSDEDVFRFQNVKHLYMELPQDKRAEVEEFLEQMHKECSYE